jgi:hypothetical protein
LARPEAKAMTAPNEKREEKGVVLDGGATGSSENALKMASRNHAVT